MTINSHPSEATLLAYAAGTLPAGASLALAAHLGFCKACRKPIAAWEGAAGTLLDSLPDCEMAENALAEAMARVSETQGPAKRAVPPKPKLSGIDLPPALLAAGIGKRRWIAPGIWRMGVPAASHAPAETYLLRLGAGRRIPFHGHGGSEMICVLKGSFSDASGRYQAGDFVEIDEATEHQPLAGPEGECICIIASESPPRMHGLIGWFLKSLAGG